MTSRKHSARLFWSIWTKVIPLFLFVACVKPPEEKPQVETTEAQNRVLILNEGLWGQNNASFSVIDLDSATVQNKVFETINGRKLGDVGNDLEIYGHKAYILVNSSSVLEILDLETLESLKSIPLFDGNVARQPRQIAFHENKAFISLFDGNVAVLDTASLSIEQYIKVGRNPEGLTVQNGKLYVANSGGLDFPNYDTTVSVISLETLEEIKRIPVRINPNNVVADDNGNVYVASRGNHKDITPLLQKIDSYSDELVSIPEIKANTLWMHRDTLFMTLTNANTGKGTIGSYSTKTDQLIADDLVPALSNDILYGLAVHPQTSELFLATTPSYTAIGSIKVFDQKGNEKLSLATSILPRDFAFTSSTLNP